MATWERDDTTTTKSEDNVFTMMRKIGQAKAGLAADYAAQLARNVGKVVFFAKHIDVMDQAEAVFEERGIRYSAIRGNQSKTAREESIAAFQNDPDVQVIVCSLTAAGVGVNLQVASNVVLAELSWTDAEQTQAIDRVHRIGQAEPVTAWRIIASQTLDSKIAELIDTKAGLAARALDGSDEEISSSVDVQLEALVALLTEALTELDAVTPGGPRVVPARAPAGHPVRCRRLRHLAVVRRPGDPGRLLAVAGDRGRGVRLRRVGAVRLAVDRGRWRCHPGRAGRGDADEQPVPGHGHRAGAVPARRSGQPCRAGPDRRRQLVGHSPAAATAPSTAGCCSGRPCPSTSPGWPAPSSAPSPVT